MALGVEDGVAVLVALDFVFGTAALGDFGGSAAINIGQEITVAVFDDFHKGLVGLDELEFIAAIGIDADADAGVEGNALLIVGNDNLFRRIETIAFAFDDFGLGGATGLGHVIQTKDHVLRGNGDRSTVGRVEDVVGGEHEELSLKDGSVAQGDMDCHLVTVEVGIEAGTHQRVQTDGFTLNKFGLEGLDTQTVQGRSTVEHDGMAFQDILKDFPHHGVLAVHNAFGRLDGLDQAAFEEFANDKGFEELGGHVLRQTALVHLEFGAHDDDGTTGIVDTFTKEVLTEATLLTLQGVGEGLEGAVAVGLDAGDLTAVVEQGVDGFLKHALLITHNDFGSLDLEQSLQTVVADDDTTIELVDVGGGKTATIEGNERTKVGRNDGDDGHNHPLRTVVHATLLHATTALAESLDNVKAFEGFLFALVGGFFGGTVAELEADLVKVEFAEQFVESLGTHTNDEFVGVGVVKLIIALGEVLHDGIVFLFGQKVEFLDGHVVEGGTTRLEYDVLLVVYNLLQFLAGHVEQSSNLVGEGTEKPDMGDRDGKLDMSHTLATDFLFGNLDAATVADDAFIADTFVLAAVALPIACGAENLLAEEAVALGFVSAIVDSLRLGHFTVGALLDRLRGCQTDGYRIEIIS